eukprot:gene2033-3951_t
MDAEPVAVVEIVNLDSLNAKQKAKEFKATSKLAKSKDVGIKTQILEKLKDYRYFLEGGCLPVFIESIIPKKKTMEFTKDGIHFLVTFLSSIPKADEGPIPLSALRAIHENNGHIDVLQVILDIMLYKEEVKTKGKEKLPHNEELENTLHRDSTQAFYLFANDMSFISDKNDELLKSFLKIPNILSKLCEVLKNLVIRFNNIQTRPFMQQECVWVLPSLVTILKHLDGGINQFIADNMLESIAILAKEPNFTLYCLQIYDMIIKDTDGLKCITSDENNIPLLLDILESSTSLLLHPPAVDNKKDKKHDEKKTPVNKKHSKDVPNTILQPDKIQSNYDPTRLLIVYIKLLVDIFNIIAERNKESITVLVSNRLVTSLCQVIMDATTVWELVRNPIAPPVDTPIEHLIDKTCMLFGQIGQAASDARQEACKTGATTTIFSILQKSRVIYGLGNTNLNDVSGAEQGSPAKPDKTDKLIRTTPRERDREGSGRHSLPVSFDENVQMVKILELRRICEKAIMHLMHLQPKTEQQSSQQEDSGEEVAEPLTRTLRWESCALFHSDEEMLLPPPGATAIPLPAPKKGAPPVEPTYPPGPIAVSSLIELVSSTDSDLSDRGVRMLAAAIQGSSNIVDFVKAVHIDTNNAIAKLTVVADRCGQAVMVHRQGLVLAPNVDTVSREASVSVDDDLSVNSLFVKFPEIPSTTDAEILALVLICLEPLLQLADSFVNTFANESIITILAKILYHFGPVGCGSGNGSVPSISEFMATIHDPRALDWISPEEKKENRSKIILRPLVLDILNIIASADAKYRKFDGEVPPAPGTPLPDANSPCGEVALLVSKLCTDPCLAIVLTESRFIMYNGTVATSPTDKFGVLPVVMNSALELLYAIGTCGPKALSIAYESIMKPIVLEGENVEDKRLASATGLKDFLYQMEAAPAEDNEDCGGSLESSMHENHSTSSSPVRQSSMGSSVISALNGGPPLPGGKANLAADYNWTAPMLFDQIFTKSSSFTQRTLATYVIEKPLLWPFVIMSGSLIALLSNHTLDVTSSTLAIKVLKILCRSPLYPDVCQPAIIDLFSGIFLSMGGGVALTSVIGRFGTLPHHEDGLALAEFLFQRGVVRENFWKKWQLDHLPEQDAMVNAIGHKNAKKVKEVTKKLGHKDKPKGKGSQVGNDEHSSVFPCEPDETHPDPNHGPDAKTWAALLSTAFDDEHAKSPASVPLCGCLLAGLSTVSHQLIQVGVAVDTRDGYGRTVLMYALALGDTDIIPALLQAGAFIDAVDAEGNPTVKYAFFTLPPGALEQILSDTKSREVKVNGLTTLLDIMLTAGAEMNVMDATGCYPVHYSVGLSSVQIVVNGYVINIFSDAYTQNNSRDTDAVLDVCKRVINAGANVNSCNHQGLLPLHVAAARGDLPLVELLVAKGYPLSINTLDCNGFLPIHYAAATCPPQAKKIIDLLVEKGNGRSIKEATFVDDRAGKSKSAKYLSQINAVLVEILGEASSPAVIKGVRLSSADIMAFCTKNGTNCFQLALAGHILDKLPSTPFLLPPVDNIDERIELVTYLFAKMTPSENLGTLLANADGFGMTFIHAISIVGVASSEPEHLLTVALGYCQDINVTCDYDIPQLHLPRRWTALHAAIARDDFYMTNNLIIEGADITVAPYVHFLSNFHTDPLIAELIIDDASNSPYFNWLLNGEKEASHGRHMKAGTPLHLAVRQGKPALVLALLKCKKVNPNAQDSTTGATALLEACELGRCDLVFAFASDKARIDLLVTDNHGRTCIDVAIQSYNTQILAALISMRKNDVVGRLVTVHDGEDCSLLKRLELENMRLADILNTPTEIKTDLSDRSLPVQDVVDAMYDETEEEVVNENSNENLEDIRAMLENSNSILSLLIATVNDAKGTGDDIHAHASFQHGNLYCI